MTLTLGDVGKRLGRQSVAYTLASLVGPGTGLVLLPVYTRFLSPADFGLIALLEVLSLLLATVFSLGMTALVPFVYVDEQDTFARRRCLGTLLIGVTGVNAVMSVLVLGAGESLIGWLLPSVSFTSFVPILVATAFLEPYWIVAGSTLQIQERAPAYAVLSAARILLSVALRITWVVVLEQGVTGFVTANLVATAAMAVVAGVVLRREVALAFTPRVLRAALAVGGPTVPNNLLAYGFRVLDRIVMDRFVARDVIGHYYMALRIADVLRLGSDVLVSSWRPIFFKEAAGAGFAQSIVPRVVRLAAVGLVAMFVALSLFAPELVALLTAPDYAGAAAFVPLLAAAMAVKGLSALPSLAVWYRKRTVYIPALTLVTVVFSIGANLVLAPRWGAWGVAVALLASWAVMATLTFALSRRLYPVAYPWRAMICAGALGGLAVLAGSWLEPGLGAGALKTALFGGFLAACLLTGCVTLREVYVALGPARAALRRVAPAAAR
jgi:O-antigen/teichoic acid export membrane protein